MVKSQKKDASFSFDSAYRNTIDLERQVDPRRPCFRLSSSPFCSMKSFLEWVTFLNIGTEWGFRGDFYTRIGTAVHRTLQEWIPLANPGILLGHWRCLHCCPNRERDYCLSCKENCPLYKEAVVGPQFCPKCKRPMMYEEFQYLLPKIPTSGHSDGILLDDPKKVLGLKKDLDVSHIEVIGKFLKKKKSDYSFPAYILEYKTTSKRKIANMTEPMIHHQAQATMYVGACHEILADKYGLINLDIKGTIIKYFSRDDPSLRSRDFIIEVENDDFYKYNKNMVYKTIKTFYNKDYERILPNTLPCSDKSPHSKFYKECEHKEMCEEYRKNDSLRKEMMKKVRPVFIDEMENFRKKFNHSFRKS